MKRVRARWLLSACLAAWWAASCPAPAATNAWTVLGGCRLESNKANDGDSFHVRHEGTSHLFRLYFVDCPETSRQVPSRVRRQAAYWDTDEASVLACGADAAVFTRQALRRPFTVHTKWKDARGNSSRTRHFAFVTTDAGEDLGEALVHAGFARAYGASDARPDGVSARKTWKRLDALEAEAREDGRGCWAKAARGGKQDPGRQR